MRSPLCPLYGFTLLMLLLKQNAHFSVRSLVNSLSQYVDVLEPLSTHYSSRAKSETVGAFHVLP